MQEAASSRLVSSCGWIFLAWLSSIILELSLLHSESSKELVGGGFCLQVAEGVTGHLLTTGLMLSFFSATDMSNRDDTRLSRDFAAASLKLFKAGPSSDIGRDWDGVQDDGGKGDGVYLGGGKGE